MNIVKTTFFHTKRPGWTWNLFFLVFFIFVLCLDSCISGTSDKGTTKVAVPKSPDTINKDIIDTLVVGLLPFDDFDAALLRYEKKEIESFYSVKCIILPMHNLPESAYNNRKRYIADSLLDYLESIRPDTVHYIVGLTAEDISTRKGNYADWGIFGLGYMPGNACVISTYRLSDESISQTLLSDRLTKTVLHELGHNFGLDHCSTVGCLMEADDYGDKIDTEGKWFCKKCQVELKGLYRHGD